MKVNVGLWIDHLKALIVVTFEGGEKKLEILSDLEATQGRGPAAQLIRFYTEVIEAIRDGESILIFGPGEAKEELRTHLGRARLGDKIIGVEPAEAMTLPQIVAKVRERYHPALFQPGMAESWPSSAPSTEVFTFCREGESPSR